MARIQGTTGAARKVVRRKPAAAAIPGVAAVTKPKVVKRATTPAPTTDVQSSGPRYGIPKANTFKKTRVFKISEGAAKPVRQTDATSSSKSPGGGYGLRYSQAYKDFVWQHLQDAEKRNVDPSPAVLKAAQDLWSPAGPSGTNDLKVDKKTSDREMKVFLAGEFKHTPLGLGSVGAPVVDVLNQTARPFHAIAGLATAGTHGFTEGLLHNKPYSFGKVFKKAGLPAGVAGVLGFGVDVVADPTTYASFGATTLAKDAAEKAATRVAAKALKAGMSEDGARTVALAAAKRAAEKAAPGKGLTVKFADHAVPGVTSVTGAAGRVVKKAAAKAPQRAKNIAGGVKNVAGDVRPQLARAGEDQAAHAAVRRVGRQARSEARTGTGEAERRAVAARKVIPKDQYANVVDAIETGRINTLPENLRGPARDLRDTFRHQKRVRRQAGVSEGDITRASTKPGAAVNYFPHALDDVLQSGGGVSSVPLKKVKLASSKVRSDVRPIKAQNAEREAAGQAGFSTNLPQVTGEYMAGTARTVAQKNLAGRLADLGRPVKSAEEVLGEGEKVFHYHNGELNPVDKIPSLPGKGRYVILNQRTVEREFTNIAPQARRTAIGAIFDRGTAGFKRIATMTPGFHARNLVGDTQMAYLAQPGHKLPGNVAQAGKAVKRLSAVEHAQESSLGKVVRSTKTIKVAGAARNIDDFLNEAQRQGVIRSGYIGRELREQGKGVGRVSKVGGKARQVGRRVNRWMQNREDLMRLATYKHGLDKGLTPEQAGELSLGVHIDYGDLTNFERSVARRAAPFYTFSARALPIHAKALIQRPGKFANIEKFREEASTATGVNLTDAEKKLKTYQARQAPLILKIAGLNGGKPIVLSDSLPLNLLNEVPTNANVGNYVSELSQWMASLANPILKDPVELYSNRSFFFRSDIENKDSPLVPAPAWVSAVYKYDRGLADKLGIVADYVDKRTGKKTWGWRGKSDYLFKSVPGAINFGQQLMTVGNRRGQTTGEKVAGFVAGVKAEPLDPVGAAMEALFQTHDSLEKAANSYTRRAKTPENLRAAAKLRVQQHQIERQIYQLSLKRGDKVPLYTNMAPSQPRPKSSGLGGGLGGGGLAGGGLGGGLGG